MNTNKKSGPKTEAKGKKQKSMSEDLATARQQFEDSVLQEEAAKQQLKQARKALKEAKKSSKDAHKHLKAVKRAVGLEPKKSPVSGKKSGKNRPSKARTKKAA